MLIVAYGTAFNEKQREIYGPVFPPILIGVMLGLMLYGTAGLGSPPFTGGCAFPTMTTGG